MQTTSALPPPPTPKEKVFAIPELLELILLHLPLRDLLVAQRVATKWRDVALTSNAIQTALFLSPSTDAMETIAFPLEPNCLGPETKILIKMGMWEPPKLYNVDYNDFVLKRDLQKGEYYVSAVLLNPLLATAKYENVFGNSYQHLAYLLTDGSEFSYFAKLLHDPAAVDSCLDMFLTQPPTSRVKIRLLLRIRGPIPEIPHCTFNTHGARYPTRPATTTCCQTITCEYCSSLHKRRNLRCAHCGAKFGQVVTSTERWGTLGIVSGNRLEGVKLRDVMAALRVWFEQTQSGLPECWQAYGAKIGINALGDGVADAGTWMLSEY